MDARLIGLPSALLHQHSLATQGLGGVEAEIRVGDRPVARNDDAYDYIVVGAGAGGAIVASRLAEAGHKVLVLEAGGKDHPVETDVPALHAIASELPPVALDYGVQHFTDPSRAQEDPKYDEALGGVLYPRGEGIGGSTIVNALITVLAHRGDWDRIAELTGDPSWTDENMMRYWTGRIENNLYRPFLRAIHRVGQWLRIKSLQNLGGHGFDGWLSVQQPSIKLLLREPQIQKIVKAAAKQTAKDLRKEAGSWFRPLIEGARRLFSRFDPNDRRMIDRKAQGLTVVPIAVDKQGRRNGVRNLLRGMLEKYPANLTVKTSALVSRIVFDDRNRATGVEILEGENLYRADDEHRPGAEGKKRILRAKNGVILAAGTFGTPQLLKLSGIGPRQELDQHGIPVRVDLPDVGENLHDRYEVPVIEEMKKDFGLLEGATFRADPKDPHFKEWVEKGGGIYSTNGVVISIIRKSDPKLKQPDLFIFGVPGSFPGYYQGYSGQAAAERNIFTWLVLKAKTENRGGSVKLRSADPQDPPVINFHYFDEGKDREGRPVSERDADALVTGVEIVRAIDRRLDDLIARERMPGLDVKTREAIRAWAKNVAWGHHATGTAAIGRVIDNELRVKGTRKLWVTDASVFPDIPGFFIAAPVMMMAEKASDMILADADRDRAKLRGMGPPASPDSKERLARRSIPDKTTRRQHRALAKMSIDPTGGRHVGISPEARGRIPIGQRDFYRAVKARQAKATGRDPSEITEHLVEGSGIRVTDPVSGKVKEVEHSLFSQRWAAKDPNGDVLVISPAYQATGRWWTPIADAASREGMLTLAMDHEHTGFSAGRPGRFDGASLAGAISLMLTEAERLRAEQGGKGIVRMTGESLGATALLMGAILAYNGKIEIPGGTLPGGDVYLGLVNPYLGKFSNRFAGLTGRLLKHLPFSLPTREFLTDVVKDPDAERRFNELAALEDVQVHPSGLISSNELIQHVLDGLESGDLKLPPNLKVGLLLTQDDASIDRRETARLRRLLQPNLVYERVIEGRDHSIVLNDQARPEIEALVRAPMPALNPQLIR